MTVAEGNRTKAGEVDYFKQFGRMSHKEYEKMKHLLSNTNRNKINHNNLKLNKEEDNEWNPNTNESNIIKNSERIHFTPEINSERELNFKTKEIRHSFKKNNLEQEIHKIDRNCEHLEYNIKGRVINENIFKTRKLSDLRLDTKHTKNYQEINEFSYNNNNLQNIQNNINYNINRNADDMKLPWIFKRPSKPNIRQMEKELGNIKIVIVNILSFSGRSITNKKLPRSRIKTIINKF